MKQVKQEKHVMHFDLLRKENKKCEKKQKETLSK